MSEAGELEAGGGGVEKCRRFVWGRDVVLKAARLPSIHVPDSSCLAIWGVRACFRMIIGSRFL